MGYILLHLGTFIKIYWGYSDICFLKSYCSNSMGLAKSLDTKNLLVALAAVADFIYT